MTGAANSTPRVEVEAKRAYPIFKAIYDVESVVTT